MYLETIRQQPNDRRDYDITYAEWWPDGAPITEVVLSQSQTTTVTGAADLTLGFAFDSQIAKVWISGGTSGATYKVTVLAVSDVSGSERRAKEIELKVRIKDD